ncbi:MAG: 16S rRNA (adenine(1518)-N(6)/adenine(1519)-N(6))-dimethyltransferase RsmA [Lachnospiraceae bacterium]|nr:16S rRNA (adenine(1518)-N(6)/adenine(1519)-N(6))-dimethyltransferase RsmA [Lachnospiraceae bacterium]
MENGHLRDTADKWIATPKNTIAVLQKYDFRFKKQLGQNFLIDLHVLDKMAKAVEVGPEDICLEIGPGIGSVTQILAERAGRVIAVEIDDRLIPILQENLADYPNVEIVHRDFLKIDLVDFFREKQIDRPVKVVANLPYYITTPILMALFESGVPLHSVSVMVQEEAARRMQAKPGGKDYGALSLVVQYFCQAYIVAHVPPNCFMPRPNVGSAVIRLTRHTEPPVKVEDEGFMFGLIRAAFGQRRKTMVNSVSGSTGEVSIPKDIMTKVLEDAGLDPMVRGEALTLEQFADLSNRLSELRGQGGF